MRADAVLVVGVYLVDQRNEAAEIAVELSNSRKWTVDQRWVALGSRQVPVGLSAITVEQVPAPVAKFSLLNRVLTGVSLTDYAYIVVCDDDIGLPAEFLDTYLDAVRRYDLALCQPARTHDSFIDHSFVEQLDGLSARRTRFVEIGPLFSIRQDAVSTLLPFDEASPMGWGYDMVWPCLIDSAGLRMGIVDSSPVSHVLRKTLAHYDRRQTDSEMQAYLAGRPHLTREDAFVILESYA